MYALFLVRVIALNSYIFFINSEEKTDNFYLIFFWLQLICIKNCVVSSKSTHLIKEPKVSTDLKIIQISVK